MKMLLGLALLIIGLPLESVRSQTADGCSQVLEPQFGKAVRTNPAIYDLSEKYGMEVTFAETCEISVIRIAPKYSWHMVAEWDSRRDDVSLSQSAYDELITKISQFGKLGQRQSDRDVGVEIISNSKSTHWEQYDRAIVRRVDQCCTDNRPKEVFSATVFYFRKMSGRVTGRKWSKSALSDGIPQIRIKNRWYMVRPEVYKKATISRQGPFEVAGPIN